MDGPNLAEIVTGGTRRSPRDHAAAAAHESVPMPPSTPIGTLALSMW
jgi:hypothetical protein